VDNQAKLDDMKQQNKNPHDIKKFQEVLDESHMMVPDSQRRYQESLRELQSFLEANEVDLTGSEWYEPAMTLVKELTGSSSTNDDIYGAADTVEETDVSNLQEGEAF
jgi:tubulin-specific chaperone A